MGRKKLTIADLRLANDETLEHKILTMFSPENLIGFFSPMHYEEYKAVINHPNIQQILKDRELMYTIYTFFDNNLNTSVTSSKTFMHRNTLNYRIDKVKKLTGLNIKLFEHAVVFKNLIIVNNLMNNSDIPSI